MLRVSEVLRLAGLTDDISRVPQYALDRGTAVHAATALNDQLRLDESSVTPEIAGHLAAWRLFRKDMGATPAEIEKAVQHAALGYRGTLDRVMLFNGARWIIDLKCGDSCARWHALQTAGYRIAYSADRSIRRGCVHLLPEGVYRFREHRDATDEQVFMAALTVAKWQKAGGAK